MVILLFFSVFATPWPDLSKRQNNALPSGHKQDLVFLVSIDDYATIPDIAGIDRNAYDWKQWFARSMGIPKRNIIHLKNQDAIRENILAQAEELARRAKTQKNPTIWFLFMGYDAQTFKGQSVLIGSDSENNEQSIQKRGIEVSALLSILERGTNKINAILDTQHPRNLPRSAGVLPRKKQWKKHNALIFSATEAQEEAGSLPNLRRPAFGYLALGALQGWGDTNKNGVVSGEEVISFAKAVLENKGTRKQTPQLIGKHKNRTLTTTGDIPPLHPDIITKTNPRNSAKASNRSKRLETSSFVLRIPIGISRFQYLNFFSLHLEGQYKFSPQKHITFGVGANITQFTFPDFASSNATYTVWSNLLAYNLGISHTFSDTLSPSIGIEAVYLPNYINGVDATAFGARINGGVQHQISPSLSLYASASLGLWHGDTFQSVQTDLQNTGTILQLYLAPQFHW